MNKNSNLYTIIYASVMVILVAVGLAFTSQALKDRQKENENIDKMQQILRSLRIDASTNEAQEKFNQVITKSYFVDANGEVVPGTEGVGEESQVFTFDPVGMRTTDKFPVYEAEVDGQKKYIFTMYGAGLWGPIWGYLSVDDDKDTVYGVDFSHAGETPGLGAEIVHEPFRKEFEGKHLFQNEQFKSISVVKHGQSVSDADYVDGISGGTLTSHGVHNMLHDGLGKYEPFLNKKN